MNLGEMRRFIQGTSKLPDKTAIIVEQKGGGQDEALCIEVCTYENGGLYYSEESIEANKDNSSFDQDCWEKLEEPTIKITMR